MLNSSNYWPGVEGWLHRGEGARGVKTTHQEASCPLPDRGNGNPSGMKTSCTPNFLPKNLSSDTFVFGVLHTEFIPFIHWYKQILTSAYRRLYTVLVAGLQMWTRQSLPDGSSHSQVREREMERAKLWPLIEVPSEGTQGKHLASLRTKKAPLLRVGMMRGWREVRTIGEDVAQRESNRSRGSKAGENQGTWNWGG